MGYVSEAQEWSCRESYQSKLLIENLDFLCNHRGLAKETIRVRRDDVASFQWKFPSPCTL